jgi:ferritin-like metal-binding protein YciE
MADVNERDAKLIQYLSEAYGKERELETALEAHITMTTRAPYKRRLQQHLRETKGHAKAVERRMKKLGGSTDMVQSAIGKAQSAIGKMTAAAQGPMHAVRGTGEQEMMLKNAKTEYFNEHEEIAGYLAIEILAEKVGDKETAKLAKGIRRDEERMARFLEGQIKSLTGAVATSEVPASQRRPGAGRRRPSSRRRARPRGGGRSAARRAAAKR